VHGDRISFVRNDNYWGPRARIAKLVFRTVPSENTLVVEMQTHEIDGALGVSSRSLEAFTKIPNTQVIKTLQGLFGIIIFNASNPQLADVRIRRAIILALNRPEIIRKATAGTEETEHPERGLFGWAYDPSIKPLPYDPKAAMQLLDEAGWKIGPDGIRSKGNSRLQFVLAFQAGHPEFEVEAAQFVQQEKAVGIQIELKAAVDQQFALLTPEGTLWGGHFDIALSRFVGGGPDPDPAWLIGCDSTGKPNPYNFTHMCMTGMAPVLIDGDSTFDVGRRKRDYAIVQRALNQQVPQVLISQAYSLDVIPLRLHNFARATMDGAFVDVGSWWLSDDGSPTSGP